MLAEIDVSSARAALLHLGIKVRTLKEGTGPPLRRGRTVAIHYTGWLTDGTAFDESCSESSGKTLSIRVGCGQAIVGWDLVLQTMRAHERVSVHFPPAVAYRAKGIPHKIPPDSALDFDIWVLGSERAAVDASLDVAADGCAVGARTLSRQGRYNSDAADRKGQTALHLASDSGNPGAAEAGIRRHAPHFPICRTPFPPCVRN